LDGYSIEMNEATALKAGWEAEVQAPFDGLPRRRRSMPAKSSLPLILALVVSAACTTSTEGSPTGAASAPPPPSGTIVFNRGTWPDIAVYSLDLGAGTEHKIRDVEDFVTMSPDGRRFVDIAWKADGSTTPATFDIDGSGYTVLKFADPTFAMAVGSGGWSPDGKRFFGGGGDATDPRAMACTRSGSPTAAGSFG
jgi:hypothetical protein